MLHDKFQSPSINTERYFQLSDSGPQRLSDRTKMWSCALGQRPGAHLKKIQDVKTVGQIFL